MSQTKCQYMKCFWLRVERFWSLGFKILHSLIVVSIKLSQDYIKSWYIDIIFYMQNRSQIYNLITTVNRYYYTGKLELPRFYVLVHLRLIHSHSHLVWLSKICVRSLCVMSELLCPNLKVLVTTLMVSPIGINNHMICLWSFFIP